MTMMINQIIKERNIPLFILYNSKDIVGKAQKHNLYL